MSPNNRPRKDTKTLVLSAQVSSPPREIQVIPFGRHETQKGAFVLDAEGMASMVADFEARENDLVIDYEHQSLGAGEAPAAGWVRKLIDRGTKGLWAEVQWTARAKRYLEGREYRYLSPVFLKGISDDRVRRLISAALTNTPAIDGMVPLVNTLSPISGESSKPTGGPGGMAEPGGSEKEENVMRALLAELGLGPDATEEDALAALRGAGQVVAAKEVLSELGVPVEATLSEALGTIVAMKQAGALAAEVPELRQKILTMEAAEMVEAAMKEGKVTPAQRDWATEYAQRDPEAFRAFQAKAPVVVHTGEIMDGHFAGRAPVTEGLQASVNSLLMISEEAFTKFKTGQSPTSKEG